MRKKTSLTCINISVVLRFVPNKQKNKTRNNPIGERGKKYVAKMLLLNKIKKSKDYLEIKRSIQCALRDTSPTFDICLFVYYLLSSNTLTYCCQIHWLYRRQCNNHIRLV